MRRSRARPAVALDVRRTPARTVGSRFRHVSSCARRAVSRRAPVAAQDEAAAEEGWGAFEGAGPDAPLTGSGWFLTPLVSSVRREESVQGRRMGLAASPWSMKGSYGKATRARSTLAWPPSGEAVDDAQHGGERSLTTRLDGRILLPADQFRPPLDRRLRHQHALERRSSLDAIQFGSYLVAQRIVKRQVVTGVARVPEVTQEALHMCCNSPRLWLLQCSRKTSDVLAPADSLPPSTAEITYGFCTVFGFCYLFVWGYIADLSMVPRLRRGRLAGRALSHPFILRGQKSGKCLLWTSP